MNFYDIRKRSAYADFMLQRRTDAPYQGTNNVYPLGARRYSARHWRYREDDGRVEIFYVNRNTRDEFEKGRMNDHQTQWLERRLLATVYPDDTVEIHSTQGIGDNSLLSELFGVRISQEARRGGEVLRNRKREVHPLFKGQRFKMDSFECVTPYEVFQRRVNRKLAAEALKPYNEFMRIAKILVDPMDAKGIWETAQDILEAERKSKQTLKSEDIYLSVHHALPWRKLDESFFDRVEQGHHVDAFVYYGLVYDSAGCRWTLGMQEMPTRIDAQWVERFKDTTVARIGQHMAKEVYYKHDAFNLKKCEMGELPSSHWNLLITVNGNPVERL